MRPISGEPVRHNVQLLLFSLAFTWNMTCKNWHLVSLFWLGFIDICCNLFFSSLCCSHEENASCGRMTYVHCKAGRGRSTTIVLCYLVCAKLIALFKKIVNFVYKECGSYRALLLQIQHKQMSPSAAYEYVKLSRPRVLLAASQWQVLEHCFHQAFTFLQK